MITYHEWRKRYVRPYENGLYVAYNVDGELEPADAVTVSEASGYCCVCTCFCRVITPKLQCLHSLYAAPYRYGLLASMLSDERSDFDNFLTYYNTTMNDQGLACWQQVRCSIPALL